MTSEANTHAIIITSPQVRLMLWKRGICIGTIISENFQQFNINIAAKNILDDEPAIVAELMKLMTS